MIYWSVLWPPRGKDTNIIWTFIDVKQDPIILQLRSWLLNAEEDPQKVPPPIYPAVGVEDHRPREKPPLPHLGVLNIGHIHLYLYFLLGWMCF